jgi:hypothetical protein
MRYANFPCGSLAVLPVQAQAQVCGDKKSSLNATRYSKV